MLVHVPFHNRRSAFTLIELMVVLIVIAIMSGMIVAEMSGGFQDALLRSSSRQLINVFSLASSRAVSLNRLHRVRFDRGTGRYIIERHLRGDDFAPVRDVAGSEGDIDSRIAIRVQEPGETPETESSPSERTPENAVNFYPDGTSDGREIELRDSQGFGLALRLSPITARVQVIELEHQ